MPVATPRSQGLQPMQKDVKAVWRQAEDHKRATTAPLATNSFPDDGNSRRGKQRRFTGEKESFVFTIKTIKSYPIAEVTNIIDAIRILQHSQIATEYFHR